MLAHAEHLGGKAATTTSDEKHPKAARAIQAPRGHPTRFATQVMAANLPKFTSNNRMIGAPQEYQAISHGASRISAPTR